MIKKNVPLVRVFCEDSDGIMQLNTWPLDQRFEAYRWIDRLLGCTTNRRFSLLSELNDLQSNDDGETVFANKSDIPLRIVNLVLAPYNIMQCDYDIDFEMPYITAKMAEADPELREGDVDDTNSDILLKWGVVCTSGRTGRIKSMKLGAPVGYRSWEDFAKYVRKIARRVWRDWRDHEE